MTKEPFRILIGCFTALLLMTFSVAIILIVVVTRTPSGSSIRQPSVRTPVSSRPASSQDRTGPVLIPQQAAPPPVHEQPILSFPASNANTAESGNPPEVTEHEPEASDRRTFPDRISVASTPEPAQAAAEDHLATTGDDISPELSPEEKVWLTSENSDTIAAYKSYLHAYPTGAYSTQAKRRVDSLSWRKAMRGNTIRAYDAYVSSNPSGLHISEANRRIGESNKDETPYLRAQEAGTRKAWEDFLADYPGHVRAVDAKAAIETLVGVDVFDLLDQTRVEVETHGSGIQNVRLKLRRLGSQPVRVNIPVGTFCVAKRSSAQNMVVTGARSVTLKNDEWHTVSMPAACANRPRDIPGTSDSFSLQKSPNQEELKKLISTMQANSVTYPVRQAAVWIITDNASYSQLGQLVSRPVGVILGGGTRVIKEYEAARAMKICDSAGIDITKKAIWRDKETILSGLRDKTLAEWIKGKTEQ